MEFVQADMAVIGFAALAQALKEIGIPSPGVTQGALVYAGYQMAHGNFPLAIIIILAIFAGSICGCTIAFGTGRYLGSSLVRHWGKYIRITPEKLQRAKNTLEHRSLVPMIFGRFVPAVMAPISVAAGTLRFSVPRYATGITISMLLWAGLFVMLGTIFGETALEMDILNGLPWVLAAAFSITVIGSIAYFIWRYLTRSRVMVADGE